jgi:hypothetical protein
MRAGNAEHVAKGRKYNVFLFRQLQCPIDEFEGRYADGTTGAMYEFDARGEQGIQSVFNDGMCLTATDFHNAPRLSGDLSEALGDGLYSVTTSVLV